MADLLTLTTKIEAAQDKAEQAQILADSLQDLDSLVRYALAHPTDFAQAKIRLSSLAGLSKPYQEWLRALKEKLNAQEAPRDRYVPASSLRPLLHTIAPESPLEAPPGYEVRPSGVWKYKNDEPIQIACHPLVILAEYRDHETREVSVRLAWLDVGGWEDHVVPRSMVTDSRKIGALADIGLDVTSGTASDVVEYLRAFVTHNRDSLERSALATRCGWIRGAFLRGHHCHGGATTLRADGGLARLADSITAAGEWGEMQQAIRDHVADRPLVLLAIYASLAAPLLELVGADGFSVDWSGPPGRGKSTAIDLACAVWGDPDRYRQGWDVSSVVGPQVMASFLHSLPLVLDDTNLIAAGKESVIRQMLYVIPSGSERLRGSKDGGARVSRTWRTVMLTTGEQPVTSYADGNAGALRRALCLTGPPTGGVSDANAAAARTLHRVSRGHYGHLGAFYIDTLTSTPQEAMKARHASLTASYDERGVGSTDRSLGAAVAVLELASELVRSFVPVSEGQRLAAIEVAWRAAVDGGANSDEPLAALLDVWEWVVSSDDRMYDKQAPAQRAPSMGWIGAIDREHSGRWIRFGVLPIHAESFLSKRGRKARFVVEEWRRRGWLTEDKGGGRAKMKMPNQRPRMLVFDADAEVSGGVRMRDLLS